MPDYCISAIIPVYNCENYIGRCINSLYSQDFDGDLEIIIVDDGSTDDTFSLCKEIVSARDIPYKLIRQANSGVSSARNTGIAAAKGEFVIFIDGDDALETGALRILYELAVSSEVDLVYGCFRKLDGAGNQLWAYRPMEKCCGIRSSCELLLELLNGKMIIRLGSFIVRKSCLEYNCIKFNEDCRFGEDIDFIIRCLGCLNKVYGTNELIYDYYRNSGSTMDKVGFERFGLIEALTSLDMVLKNIFCGGIRLTDILFLYYIPYSILFHIDQLILKGYRLKDVIAFLQGLNYYSLIKSACKSGIRFRIRAKARLLLKMPSLYCITVRLHYSLKKAYRKLFTVHWKKVCRNICSAI